jgi:hypothetical protein
VSKKNPAVEKLPVLMNFVFLTALASLISMLAPCQATTTAGTLTISQLPALVSVVYAWCHSVFSKTHFSTGVRQCLSWNCPLIGFLISRTLPTPLTPQEIIVAQTTAVATGTMLLAAGFVGILPALTLLLGHALRSDTMQIISPQTLPAKVHIILIFRICL